MSTELQTLSSADNSRTHEGYPYNYQKIAYHRNMTQLTSNHHLAIKKKKKSLHNWGKEFGKL